MGGRTTGVRATRHLEPLCRTLKSFWSSEGWKSGGRVNRDKPPEEAKLKLAMDYAEGLQERFNLGPFSLADEPAETLAGLTRSR